MISSQWQEKHPVFKGIFVVNSLVFHLLLS